MMVEQQSIDELMLLGEDLGESDKFYNGDINEDELLGLTEHTSQETTTNATKTDLLEQKVSQSSAANDETEQLDYDEEDDEEKPREKFSSERKQENAPSTDNGNAESGQKPTANKCFVNPKFRNRLPNPTSSTQNSLPSLLSQPILPPGPQTMRPPVDVNVMTQMVMMNSLRPIVPINPINRPMGFPGSGFPIQNPTFPPLGVTPMSMPNRPLGPITAQIGQLSTIIHQQDDGTITFRTKIPPSQPPRVTIARAGCMDQEKSKDWNSMVDEFIKGQPRPRKRRSRSQSTRSRTYSNSSRSDSYSDDSYSSRSDSSRSPSPSRHRRKRRSPSRKRHRSSYRHSSYRRHRHERSRRSPRRHRDSKSSEFKNTMECAEAVGVDQDYVHKLEEQKKLREELTRQKYQRDNNSRNDDVKRGLRRNEESSSRQRRSDDDRGRSKTESRPSQLQQVQTTNVPSNNSENRVKPYLVVVINNLANLSDAYKRLRMIATAVGPTKKVWQTSDDSVSIIFEHHEHAKNFMLQYHMKQFNGITLNIGLEKIFLNLASIP